MEKTLFHLLVMRGESKLSLTIRATNASVERAPWAPVGTRNPCPQSWPGFQAVTHGVHFASSSRLNGGWWAATLSLAVLGSAFPGIQGHARFQRVGRSSSLSRMDSGIWLGSYSFGFVQKWEEMGSDKACVWGMEGRELAARAMQGLRTEERTLAASREWPSASPGGQAVLTALAGH